MQRKKTRNITVIQKCALIQRKFIANHMDKLVYTNINRNRAKSFSASFHISSSAKQHNHRHVLIRFAFLVKPNVTNRAEQIAAAAAAAHSL